MSLARQSGVNIREYANVGNHLHLLIKAPHRACLLRFLRAATGIIPRILFHCEKGKKLGFSFWDGRPYTKIIALGRRPFLVIHEYLNKNRKQASQRWRNVNGFTNSVIGDRANPKFLSG